MFIDEVEKMRVLMVNEFVGHNIKRREKSSNKREIKE